MNTALIPAAAFAGLLWGIGASASAANWQMRLALGVGAALSQVIIQLLCLELAAVRTRFVQALVLGGFIGSAAGAVLIFGAKLFTHHRPLGAVSVAVVAVGCVFALTLLIWRLISQPRLSGALGWLPLALVGMLAAGVSGDARVSAWLGVAIAVALKLFAHKITARAVPGWVGVVAVSLVLVGNVVAWQTGAFSGSGEIGLVLGGACAWLSGLS